MDSQENGITDHNRNINDIRIIMSADPTTLGLYVHIPFCQKKCPYCAFYSESIEQGDPAALIDTILAELELYRITEPVETIYIGGGSPTCLPHELLAGLVKALAGRFGQVDEFTIECNPAQANAAFFEQLSEYGVNRLSIGAQSFDAAELKTLGRIHHPGHITDAVRMAKAAGFKNIGLDLIFAIPGSSIESWRFSLEKAIAMEVQHISAYSLTIEKNTPFEDAISNGKLFPTDEKTDRSMYETAIEMFANAGYNQYEISNYAKPGYECEHNLKYWKNLPVVGIGPAAATWYRGKRSTNIANIAEYMQNIQRGQFSYDEAETPTPKQIASETAILGLRMTEGIDLFEYKSRTGFDLFPLFWDAIKMHCFDGLMECTSDHCRLTEKGRSLADTVSQNFIL